MIDKIWEFVNQYFIIFIGIILFGLLWVLVNLASDWVKSRMTSFWNNVIDFVMRNEKHQIPSITYSKVLNELIELRIKLNADRAYIFQFHNGEYFGGMHPRWKMSQTYETCVESVTYQGKTLQNLDVTLFWDMLQILYGAVDVQGITMYDNNLFCTLKDCKPPRQIFLVDVNKMDGNRGFTKSLLLQQGINYMLISPILSPDSQIIGFIGIDYCEESALEDIIKQSDYEGCLLCQSGSNVGLVWALDPSLKKRAIKINKKLLKKQNV